MEEARKRQEVENGSMTPAERKRLQRQRDRLCGWVEVTVKVPATRAQEVKDFAAAMPPPDDPVDPRQLSLIEELDQALGRDESRPQDDRPQGSLF